MIHYSQQYIEFGPLRHQSTLCFERKHSKLKNIIRASINWKNSIYTISSKIARINCIIDFDNCQDNDLESLSYSNEVSIVNQFIATYLNYDLQSEDEIFEVRNFEMNGNTYRPDMAVIIDSNPKFLIIKRILKFKGIIYFFGSVFDFLIDNTKNVFILHNLSSQRIIPYEYLNSCFQSYHVYKFTNLYIFPFLR